MNELPIVKRWRLMAAMDGLANVMALVGCEAFTRKLGGHIGDDPNWARRVVYATCVTEN